MNVRLQELRSRLAALRRRRSTLRLLTGAGGFVGVLVLLLLAGFALDVTFEPGRFERLLILTVCLTGIVLAWKFLLRPFLGHRETDLDMALLVESRQRIDSDLVAALQFDSQGATRWGSVSLREAVIDYVADFGPTLNVFEGLPVRQCQRRAAFGAVSLVVLLVVVALWPWHVAVFGNRLLLGSRHYPSQPGISRITINNRVVPPDLPLRFPRGKSLEFAVEITGPAPKTGILRLIPARPESWGPAALVRALVRWGVGGSSASPDSDAVEMPLNTASSAGRLIANIPELTESFEYQVLVGSTWTDPRSLEMTPLPAITLDLKANPPEYALHAAKTLPAARGSQVVSVIEGSDVGVTVTCANKALQSATLLVAGKSYALKPADSSRRVFRLESEGTPFGRVEAPITFSVQVVDEDELGLEKPLPGFVRLQTDREPRISAAIVTDRVLPEARPTIGYKATDDYGLHEIRMHREVTRAGGEVEKSMTTVTLVKPDRRPATTLPDNPAGLTFDLLPLKLEKGDKVSVTLEAIDFRGRTPGKSATSEPVVFQVTDQAGILEGLTDADQKSARQLDVLIQRQLGIGDAP